MELGEALQSQTRIFPNPFKNQLVLEGFLKGTDYRLMDVHGRILMEGVVESENEVISVQNFVTGFFLLQVGEELFRVLKD